MTENRPPKPDPRRERLEAELRENLRKRKEQARARKERLSPAAGPGDPADDEDA